MGRNIVFAICHLAIVDLRFSVVQSLLTHRLTTILLTTDFWPLTPVLYSQSLTSFRSPR